MTLSDKDFIGSIPEIYDQYLVPLIFEVFAQDLAERVAALRPVTVLETAAGSGVVARALAPLLPSDSEYTVTDLNQPMLNHAAARQDLGSRVSWRMADALNLPFGESTFDVVACQFGIMFYPDRVAGYREALRVLKPGGALIFNVWDSIETSEFANAVTTAVADIFPNDPPRFLSRTPHGYHDETLIREELSKAGFTDVSRETLETDSTAPSPRHPAVAYCQGTPLRNEIEARSESNLGHVTSYVADAIAEQFGPGPVTSKILGHIFTAIR